MKLIHKVKTDFFCDDASGNYGLAHSNTIKSNGGADGFNAFWDGRGIFHDVFEHAHEHSECFHGDAAMNIGGEMAAMGAMYYFIETLYVLKRRFNSFRSGSDSVINETIGYIEEAIEYGQTNFGETLVSNVGEVKETEKGEFEEIDLIVQDYFNRIKAIKSDYFADDFFASDEIMLRERFRASITEDKLKNLHRWGYREAKRIAPINHENTFKLNNFISFWSDFTKKHDAEKLANYFHGITFFVFHDKNDCVFWRAVLRGKFGTKSIVLNEDSRFFLEDAIYTNEKNT